MIRRQKKKKTGGRLTTQKLKVTKKKNLAKTNSVDVCRFKN